MLVAHRDRLFTTPWSRTPLSARLLCPGSSPGKNTGSEVAQSCPTLCDPTDCSLPGSSVHGNSRQEYCSGLPFPSPHQLPKPTQTHVHMSLMPSNHFILCHPLLLPPAIFPSIGVFSNESVLCISWPKYWCFNISISPSNEYSGLISFIG